MKKIIQYTAVLIALTFAASCNQIDYLDTDNGLISFAPKSVATKAMVTSVNLTGQAFTVIDLMGTTRYIDDAITFDQDNNAWVFASGNTYLWKDGSHKFFGYTRGSSEHDIGTLSGTTLTIPETILSTSANQTDLLYSSIISTTATAWKSAEGHTTKTPVPLEFHHLLSAISITLENYTGSALTVNSVTVTLPNKASATVTFGTEAVPYISDVATSGTFGGFSNAVPMDPDEIVDVLEGSKLEGDNATATPYMIWPQTLTEGAATITVNYTSNGGTETSNSVSLPANVVWEAGKINTYNLRLYPESLDLTFEVQDWEQVPMPINTNLGSINMSNVTWMNSKVRLTSGGSEVNTVVNSSYSVMMYHNPIVNGEPYDGYFPAQGYFTVNYPISGKFKLGLIPAYGETTVDVSKYEIYIYDTGYNGTGAPWRPYNEAGEDISINTVYFQVRAASNQDRAEHKAQLDIWLCANPTADNPEWVSAYSEIRANYALTIPAAN